MADITPEQEKTLYALGFLYIAASHATDSELTKDEMRTVAERVSAWDETVDTSFVAGSLQKSMTLYRSFDEGEPLLNQIHACATLLARKMERQQLEQILKDLMTIAEADGEVAGTEKDFIEATAKTFGIAIESSVSNEDPGEAADEGHSVDVDAGDGGDAGDFDDGGEG